MRSIVLLILFVLAITSTLSGCSRFPDVLAPKIVLPPGETYLLEPGNRVRVMVFNEPNLSGDFAIDTAGNIFLPLIGNIPSSGLTAKTLAHRIEETLQKANYMRDPKVSVEVQTFRPLYVMGEVRQPGEFAYTMGMTVLTAVAKAGGYDVRAKEGVVVLVRTLEGEQKEYKATENTPLMPGDIIKVQQRYF